MSAAQASSTISIARVTRSLKAERDRSSIRSLGATRSPLVPTRGLSRSCLSGTSWLDKASGASIRVAATRTALFIPGLHFELYREHPNAPAKDQAGGGVLTRRLQGDPESDSGRDSRRLSSEAGPK